MYENNYIHTAQGSLKTFIFILWTTDTINKTEDLHINLEFSDLDV